MPRWRTVKSVDDKSNTGPYVWCDRSVAGSPIFNSPLFEELSRHPHAGIEVVGVVHDGWYKNSVLALDDGWRASDQRAISL